VNANIIMNLAEITGKLVIHISHKITSVENISSFNNPNPTGQFVMDKPDLRFILQQQ